MNLRSTEWRHGNYRKCDWFCLNYWFLHSFADLASVHLDVTPLKLGGYTTILLSRHGKDPLHSHCTLQLILGIVRLQTSCQSSDKINITVVLIGVPLLIREIEHVFTFFSRRKHHWNSLPTSVLDHLPFLLFFILGIYSHVLGKSICSRMYARCLISICIVFSHLQSNFKTQWPTTSLIECAFSI